MIPTTQAATLPTIYCPSAPILNTPVRKENATDKPVKITGAAYTKVQTKYFGLLKTLSNSLPYATAGEIPAIIKKIAPIANPIMIARTV